MARVKRETGRRGADRGARDERLNIYRIARETGFSIATVSRVLNNKARVAEETRKAVLDVMRRLNYVPKLRPNRRLSIGILLEYSGSVMTSYVAEIINGVSRFAFDHGVRISIFSVFAKEVGSTGLLDYLRDNDIDGVIVLLSNDHSTYIKHLEAERYPYIVVNNRLDGSINYVEIDNYRGAELAVSHLLQLGHRRIVCLAGTRIQDNFRDRLRGYRETLKRWKIAYDERLVPNGEDDTSPLNHLQLGYDKMRRVILDDIPFTAVFCSSDDFAFGALRAITEAGLEVPGDVSVVGFDDYEVSTYIRPPLTTIRQPLEEMGSVAAAELLKIVNVHRNERSSGALPPAEGRVVRRTFTPELKIRGSTAAPRKK